MSGLNEAFVRGEQKANIARDQFFSIYRSDDSGAKFTFKKELLRIFFSFKKIVWKKGLRFFCSELRRGFFCPCLSSPPLLPTLAPTEPPPTQASKRRDEKLASLKSDFAYPLPLPSFLVLPQKKKKSLTLAPPQKKICSFFMSARAWSERTVVDSAAFFPFPLLAVMRAHRWLLSFWVAGWRSEGWVAERERERGGGGKERRTGRRRPSIPPFPPLLSLKGTIFSPRDEEKKNSPFLVFLPGRARIRHAENKKNLSASAEWESA